MRIRKKVFNNIKKIISLIIFLLFINNYINVNAIPEQIEDGGVINTRAIKDSPVTVAEGLSIAKEAKGFLGWQYGSLAEHCESETNGRFIHCVILNATRKRYSTNPKELMSEVTMITYDNLRKGDLVFFHLGNECLIGIYVGNGRMIINLPSYGVVYRLIDTYWKGYVIGYGRP